MSGQRTRQELEELVTELRQQIESLSTEHSKSVADLLRENQELRESYESRSVEVAALERSLMTAQRYEPLAILVGTFAHDFKNLLTTIVGNLDLLKEDLPKDDPNKEYVDQALLACARSNTIAQNILAHSRRSAYNPSVLDMNKIVQESLVLFHPDHNEAFLTIIYGVDLYPVYGDRTQIEQALLNLYINSVQAMDNHGTMIISTSNIIISGRYASTHGADPGEYTRICVADTGCGMNTKTLEKIFDPFYTTKKEGVGTGLGMYIIKKIMEEHKGFIDVNSQPGKGTRVSLFFPRHYADVGSEVPEDTLRKV